MKRVTRITSLLIALFAFHCSAQSDNILVSVYDTITDDCGYRNLKGEMVIPFGKYPMCFTDTLDHYAIVLNPDLGFVAIDRDEKVLYEIFPFDNGPDYESDGMFRIIEDGKIGYADAKTGEVVIKPQYQCAELFENGVAKVTFSCTTESDGEYTSWSGDQWFYINKKGRKVKARKKE